MYIIQKTDSPILSLIFKLENKMMFGQPFYVVAEDQLNLKKFKIKKNFKTEIGARTIASLGLFLYRIKNTRIIIYGKDIRRDIPNSVPVIEKVKAFFNTILLFMMSFIIFPYDAKSAFIHVVKANFWACGDVLFALDEPLSTSKQEVMKISSIFCHSEINSNHLMLSLEYKKTKHVLKMNKIFILSYMFKSLKFIYQLYAITLKKLFSS